VTQAAMATRALVRGAFAALVVLGALATLTLPEGAAAAPGGKGAGPNVVVIVSDDQAVQTVRPDVMPNLLERVAGSGTTFENAIATTPLCCPSRAGMLTGQYGHNNGVLRNDYRQLDEKSNTLPVWLDRAGYRTIHVGKYLNLYRKAKGPEAEPAPGWDVWHTIQEPNTYYDYDLSVNGREVHYGVRDRDYLTDVLNRKATRLVRRSAAQKRPFYLQLDHWAPHDSRGRDTGPCHGGDDPVPAPTDENLFAGEPFPTPPSFNEPDVEDKPSFVQRQQPVDAGVVARSYRCALASLRSVDDGVRRIHGALRKAGELKRTVIVYIGDNGLLYGEHRLRFKIPPYEEALQVPLIVSAPSRTRDGARRVATVDEPVANIDLAPTILELADATPCRRPGDCRVMDGRSMMPLLRGEEDRWPQDRALAVEYTGRHHGFSSCSYRGVRAPGHLYVEHTLVPNFETGECEPRLEVEHYDLEADPFELENLYPASAPSATAAQQEELRERLAGLRDCAGIAGRDPVRGAREHCE